MICSMYRTDRIWMTIYSKFKSYTTNTRWETTYWDCRFETVRCKFYKVDINRYCVLQCKIDNILKLYVESIRHTINPYMQPISKLLYKPYVQHMQPMVYNNYIYNVFKNHTFNKQKYNIPFLKLYVLHCVQGQPIMPLKRRS